MIFALAAVLGYLLGSIPFGLILTRLGGYGDIRDIGSGNIGATNVLRTGNKKLALATLLLDSLKGAAAVFAMAAIMELMLPANCALVLCVEGAPCECTNYGGLGQEVYLYIAGFFALLGHLFPVWLKFKGGKGVATTLGTLLALAPYVGLAACAIWLSMAAVFRYSSLAALAAIGFTPLIAHYIYDDPNLSGLCAMIAVLVWIKHRANIKRLCAGEEPRINLKKS